MENEKGNGMECGFPWAEAMNCAVTVCDKEGVIVYMNRKSRETFCKEGKSLIGSNLFGCHPEHAREKIRHMLSTGESNAYTILKHGVRNRLEKPACLDAQSPAANLMEILDQLPLKGFVIHEQIPAAQNQLVGLDPFDNIQIVQNIYAGNGGVQLVSTGDATQIFQ